MARANKHLGPTAANLYMPLQPVTTVFIDYMTLGDAVYVANIVRSSSRRPFCSCLLR